MARYEKNSSTQVSGRILGADKIAFGRRCCYSFLYGCRNYVAKLDSRRWTGSFFVVGTLICSMTTQGSFGRHRSRVDNSIKSGKLEQAAPSLPLCADNSNESSFAAYFSLSLALSLFFSRQFTRKQVSFSKPEVGGLICSPFRSEFGAKRAEL